MMLQAVLWTPVQISEGNLFFPGRGGIGTIKQMIKNGVLEAEKEVHFAVQLTEILKDLCLILITGHCKFDKGSHTLI